jgi:hypothetical protein
MMQPPCFFACTKPANTLAGDVQHLTLFDLTTTVRPAEGNMHFEVEYRESLAALWFSPEDYDADTRNELMNEIRWRGVEVDVPELAEPKTDIAGTAGGAVRGFCLLLLPVVRGLFVLVFKEFAGVHSAPSFLGRQPA